MHWLSLVLINGACTRLCASSKCPRGGGRWQGRAEGQSPGPAGGGQREPEGTGNRRAVTATGAKNRAFPTELRQEFCPDAPGKG